MEKMKVNDLLFVYGSLRRGQGADLSAQSGTDFIGSDHINGKLYDLGWYPGAEVTPGEFTPGQPFIFGDVFRITSEERIRALDSYEGYPNLFNRVETMSAAGRHVWVYVYNHGFERRTRVCSADWSEYTELRGER